MKSLEYLIGFFLGALLITGIIKDQKNDSIDSVSSEQLELSLNLGNAYGRVNAISSEYIHLLIYGQDLSKGKKWNKKVKNVPLVYNKLESDEQQIWSDSLVNVLFVRDLDNLSDQFQEESTVVNTLVNDNSKILQLDKRRKSSQKWIRRIESGELFLICLVLILYMVQIRKNTIKKPQNTDVSPQENNNDLTQ